MRRLTALVLTVGTSLVLSAQTHHYMQDSVQHVEEVVVLSKPSFREVIPSQRLNGDQLERLSSHSVADALRYFSGLQIKDYGGVGGLKTINIRSMGTHHLGIFYDGIELGNAQNGQIDLGQFSLDNVEEIALYNGQKSAIFQPASDFGNAGSVYIRTRIPRFTMGERYHLKMKVQYGSSDKVHLAALWEQRLSAVLSSSVSGGLLTSSGRYKFRYRRLNTDHTIAYDTTAIRQNGAIHAMRMEGNLHGTLKQGVWHLKAYTYHSSRGIPGAIVNNVWRRGEHQDDHNSFLQAHLQKNLGNRLSTQWMAKYAYYNTHYVNNDTTQMLVNNRYQQQELYFSTANVVEIVRNWSASVSYDFRWNKLDADVRPFAYPHRFSNMLSMATAIDLRRLKIQASILGIAIKDHTRTGQDEHARHALIPAVFASFSPLPSKEISLRAFAKKSFRMPSFNDLYYTEIGNARLKPEQAIQYDAGACLDHHIRHPFWKKIRLQGDLYYNTVRDKIIAYPKGQQFRWTMMNLGHVQIRGIETEVELTVCPMSDMVLTTRAQYTYQNARDMTDPKTSYYKDQIPYIPWHSGSAIVCLSYQGWDLNYSFIYSGERYSQQENIMYNHLQPWYTSDLSLTYRFSRWHAAWRVTLEVNNLLSQDYDVILNYPMPKRNYALSINIQL